MADPNVTCVFALKIDIPRRIYRYIVYKSKHDQEQAGVGSGWVFLGVSVYYDL